jgi:Macrocin-O-methyltransferase (TylF)
MSIQTNTVSSVNEQKNRLGLADLINSNPIPDNEKSFHVPLYLKRQELSKILYFQHLYQQFINTHGVMMEFGTRWGTNMVTLSNLRGILEPFNYNRKIIGFDTFEGFKNTNLKEDGNHEIIKDGAFSVTENYTEYLEQLLSIHQNESPINHIKKFEILKGDAPIKLEEYLKKNPQTIIAFAHFDFDIYKPTLDCLNLIKPHLVKGSIISFDELNDSNFPGETKAVNEAFGLNNIELKRFAPCPMQSYFIF